MKKMIKIFVFVSAVLMVSNLNAQQQRRTPEDRAKMETDTVKQLCSLTDAQVAKFTPIALKYAKLEADLRASGIPRDSMMVKRTALGEQKLAEMKQVLTAEQFPKYEKWLKEMAARRGGNRGGGQRPQ
jgi:hypothetical protein